MEKKLICGQLCILLTVLKWTNITTFCREILPEPKKYFNYSDSSSFRVALEAPNLLNIFSKAIFQAIV